MTPEEANTLTAELIAGKSPITSIIFWHRFPEKKPVADGAYLLQVNDGTAHGIVPAIRLAGQWQFEGLKFKESTITLWATWPDAPKA